MSMPGMGEMLIIFFIVLVIFGAGKIPKIAKDLGLGIKEFKKTMNEDEKTAKPVQKKTKKQ